MVVMNTLKRLLMLGGVGLWVLAGCATPPQPFHYQPDNELKPGPGLFTGEAGVYTIYGTPPSGPEAAPASGEEDASLESNDPAAP
jgi:hypothetical protein